MQSAKGKADSDLVELIDSGANCAELVCWYATDFEDAIKKFAVINLPASQFVRQYEGRKRTDLDDEVSDLKLRENVAHNPNDLCVGHHRFVLAGNVKILEK